MRFRQIDLEIGVFAAAVFACGSAWGAESASEIRGREYDYRSEDDGDLVDWFDYDDETRFTPGWEAWDWDIYDYDAYQDPYVYEDFEEGPLAYDRYGYDIYDPDVYGSDPSGDVGRQYDQPRGYWGTQGRTGRGDGDRNIGYGGSEPSWKEYGESTASPGSEAITRIRGEVRELKHAKQSRNGPMLLVAVVRTDGGYFRRVSLGSRDRQSELDFNVGDTIVVVGRFETLNGLPTIVADRIKIERRQRKIVRGRAAWP